MIMAVLFFVTAVDAADNATGDDVQSYDANISVAMDADEQSVNEDNSDFISINMENESENDNRYAVDDSENNISAESDGEGEFIDASEAYFYLNQFRREKGAWFWASDDVSKVYFNTLDTNQLEPLIRNEALEETAKIRAKEAAEEFSHTRPDGTSCDTAFPDNLFSVGECLARYYATCEDVTEGWKEIDQPFEGQGHRRMMLTSNANCVGIAGYKTSDGAIFWAQDYGMDDNYSISKVEYLESPINLNVPDIVKSYYDYEKQLEITLTDSGVPISNAELQIEIEGKSYNATTDSEGKAFANINLDIGVHKAVVTYGDFAATAKIKIIPINLVAPEAIGVYGDTRLTITLTNNSLPLYDELIRVTVWGVAYYFQSTNSDGVVNMNFNDLNAGIYDAEVEFEDVHVETKIIINKIKPEINLYCDNVSYNGVILNASLTPAVTEGNITFNVNGKIYSKIINGSEVFLELPNLEVGNYTANVAYGGDVNYESSVSTIQFTIDEVKITADDLNKIYGESKNFTAYLTIGNLPFENEKIIININGTDYTKITDSKGMVSLPVELSSGEYDVTASFDEISATSKITVAKAATDIYLAHVENSHDSVTVTASIFPTVNNGNISFDVNGKKYDGIIKNSKSYLRLDGLECGNYTVGAIYNGDKNHNSSVSQNITFEITEYYINIYASNLTKYYKGTERFAVSVIDNRNKPVSNEAIVIHIGNKNYRISTDDKGYASIKIDLAPKKYSVKVTCGDVSVIRKVIVKSIVTAKNINAKKSAKSLKIKVSLKKVNNKYLKNQKITLKFNKKSYKLITNKKGAVTFTVNKKVYNKLKINKKYTYQVIYGKDKVTKTIKFKK